MNPVRTFTAADIPAAMKLKEAAGWNQTVADWRNVLQLAPDGCFGIDGEGTLRATATAVSFGRDLAWIGMVLTDPAYRGQGLARRLMEHALACLRARGARWIKLDATDMGRPLYSRLGFHDECAIERWLKPPGRLARGEGFPGAFVLDAALDREAFGADRSALLGVLSGVEAASLGDGYAMGRPGTNAAYFGPCVARSRDSAHQLAAWFCDRHAEESIYWDVLESNTAAPALAREFGFAPVRRLIRMSLSNGQPPPLGNRDDLVFATAGFEYG